MRQRKGRRLLWLMVVLLLSGSLSVPVHGAEGGRRVRVCGNTIGIYMETDGVLVIGTGEIPSADGREVFPARNIVRAGDYICEVDGVPLEGKQHLLRLLAEADGDTMELLLRRKGQMISAAVQPVMTKDGEYRLGIWVRDNMQGIGTMTFVEMDGTFGALGHAISDVDTGEMLALQEGEVYETEIFSVIRGRQGKPGELQGVIRYDKGTLLGKIASNSGLGITGKLSGDAAGKLHLLEMETMSRKEVREGPVEIYADVDGEVKAYAAQIIRIENMDKDTNKNFAIRIEDDRLLARTGGIVQGMSGSPIIQNGKLVGAVTHVLVDDPTEGYGIFIGNMLSGKHANMTNGVEASEQMSYKNKKL